jgi:multidrug resistance efflux pump
VKLAETKLTQARLAAENYVLRAPGDGTILRVLADEGSVFGGQSRQPAVWFQPQGPLVVRADIDQEFVSQVRVGQVCELQDETSPTRTWTGRVVRLAQAYLPKRPMPMNDAILTTDPARTLETVIEVTSAGDVPLLVGQRVRVTIKQPS